MIDRRMSLFFVIFFLLIRTLPKSSYIFKGKHLFNVSFFIKPHFSAFIIQIMSFFPEGTAKNCSLGGNSGLPVLALFKLLSFS